MSLEKQAAAQPDNNPGEMAELEQLLNLGNDSEQAKVMKPAFDVPNIGRIVILQEPGGAGIGWMTPAG